ncbi:MFS transporter [Nocardia callitridis]|uniref:MFS transporter n=2 Tax=Nocardia callitridis TaxID=648753 RepID=A0ABP9KC13_9NOCA
MVRTALGPRKNEKTPNARWVMALACLGSFCVVLDATIVSVTLPQLRRDLGFTDAALPWAVNAYTLAFAGCLLLGGRCVDVFGLRRAMMIGTTLFTVAMAVAGLAQSPAMLLAARAVQGFGAALLMPVTLSLMTTTFVEHAARARALALLSAVGAMGASSGPLIGGILTQLAGWRWVFLVMVPLGVVCVVGAAVVLNGRVRGQRRPRLDVPGALLATTGVAGVVSAIMRSSEVGWVAASVLGSLLSGVAALGIFVVHQAKWARDPLLALEIFRLRSVTGANLVIFLLGLGFFANPVLLSLYLQDVHGFSPLMAGVGYLPAGVAMVAGARSAGWLTVRIGPRRAAASCCGLGVLGAAMIGTGMAMGASYLWSVALPGVVFGFGASAAFTPLTVSATQGVSAERNGLAAGVLNTVRQTSGAVGLAVLSSVTLAAGYSAAFLACAGCMAGACALALLAMPRTSALTQQGVE